MKIQTNFIITGDATITVTAKTEEDAWVQAEDILLDGYYGDVFEVEWEREGIERDGDTFLAKFFVEGGLSAVVTVGITATIKTIWEKGRKALKKKDIGDFEKFQDISLMNYSQEEAYEESVL
ncbi:MAG: hypothetical protein IKZ87_00595 [Actinomycetaceae bacterium]|nr:hypothetical protein [Actinomycetaceae bacterium]